MAENKLKMCTMFLEKNGNLRFESYGAFCPDVSHLIRVKSISFSARFCWSLLFSVISSSEIIRFLRRYYIIIYFNNFFNIIIILTPSNCGHVLFFSVSLSTLTCYFLFFPISVFFFFYSLTR